MAQEKKGLSEEEQLDRMLERYNERYMPKLLGFSAGYATPNVFDFSIFSILGAFPINITDGYRIHVGYDPLHLRVDDIGASDDALFAVSTWFLFNGIDDIANKITGSESEGPGILVLATLFIWCGNVYIPLVPGSWLGINDQNHFTTHVIQEGFHTRSFTYTNDLSLRFSAKPSSSGFFLDTGIRFEKNFAEDFKYRFFVQLGLFGSG
jgi:hypothetical protein|nr:hypothetical protein [uncultured Fibrobacter sp.]